MPDNIKVSISLALDQTSVNAIRSSIQSQLNNLKLNIGGSSSSLSGGGTSSAIKDIGTSADKAAKHVKGFGDQLQFTATRLAAYYIAAGAFFRLTAAVGNAAVAIVDLDKQVNRLTQIFNGNKKAANDLTDQIIEFGIAYGQSAREVLKIADTLAQAGDKFGGNARQIADIASSIAKTNLAATFGDISETTEGLIAVINQFNLSGKDTIKVLDVANGLAKEFAFEASDLFEAVKSGGGAFALADGDMRNFAATVTALRSITRLSAASIGTALNTISVRSLKEDTIDYLDSFSGNKFRNADGSLKALSDRFIELARLTKNYSDEALGPVLEKVSDTRQAKFLIPLIRDIQKGGDASQFLKALDASKRQSGSFTRDVAIGLDRIEVQIGSIGAKFEEVFKSIASDNSVKAMVKDFANLAKNSADVIKELTPLLPLIAKIGIGLVVLKGTRFAFGKVTGAIESSQTAKIATLAAKATQAAQTTQLMSQHAQVVRAVQISKIKPLGPYTRPGPAQRSVPDLSSVGIVGGTEGLYHGGNGSVSIFGPAYSQAESGATSITPTSDKFGVRAGMIARVIRAKKAANKGLLLPGVVSALTSSIPIDDGSGRFLSSRTTSLSNTAGPTSFGTGISSFLQSAQFQKIKQRYGYTGLSDTELMTFAKNSGALPKDIGLGGAGTQRAQTLGTGIASRQQQLNQLKSAAQAISFNGALQLKDEDVIRTAKQRGLIPQSYQQGGIYDVAKTGVSTPGSAFTKVGDIQRARKSGPSYSLVPLPQTSGPKPFVMPGGDAEAAKLTRINNARIAAFGTGGPSAYSSKSLAYGNQISANQLKILDIQSERAELKTNIRKLSVQLVKENANLAKALAGPKFLSPEKFASLTAKTKALESEIGVLTGIYKTEGIEEKNLRASTKELATKRRQMAELADLQSRINRDEFKPSGLSRLGRSLDYTGTGFNRAELGRTFGGFVPAGKAIGRGLMSQGGATLLSLGGSLIADSIGSRYSKSVNNDILGGSTNLDPEYIKKLQENLSNASKGSAASGAGTGLALGGLVGSSFGPIGTAVGAIGGGIIGGVRGAITGNEEQRLANQRAILGAAGVVRTDAQKGQLELSFIRSINKEGGFGGGTNEKFKNSAKGGNFSITGSPNAFKTDTDSLLSAPITGTVKAISNGINKLFGGKGQVFADTSTDFRTEYIKKLTGTEEGKANLQSFKERAVEVAGKLGKTGQDLEGTVRQQLIQEEVERLKKGAAIEGKKLSSNEALAIASETVSAKMKAAGLTLSGVDNELQQAAKATEDYTKQVNIVKQQFSQFGPSITGFISKFSETTNAINANTQFKQVTGGVSDSVISGIFGNTSSINTAGLGKALTEKLKSDVDRSSSAKDARNITGNALSGFLNQSDLSVFQDISSVQRGLGGINENVVSRLGGKVFASTDNVESQIGQVLPSLFKAQGIDVKTGEGKDLLEKVKQDLIDATSNDKGRADFNQDKAGFITKTLQKFGANLDVAGGRLEAVFADLQSQIDKSNQSFAQYRAIQQKLIEADNQKLNNGLSRIRDLSSIGATSEQSGGAISGLIRGLNPNIANGSTVTSAAALVAQRQREVLGIQSQVDAAASGGRVPSKELLLAANNAQQRLTQAQDQYSRSVNDANNAMTLLRARVEETSKQFNTLMGTAKSIGSQSTGQFTGEKFQLEQSSSLLGGFAKRLSAAGVGSADQFVTLSKEKQNALLGDTRGLLGSEQLSSLLPVLDKNNGLKFDGTNITTGNVSDVLKAAVSGNTNIRGFENTGTGLNALGKSRQADLSTIANIQNSQLDSMNIINQSVIGIYEFLTRGSKNPDDQQRLKELQQSQQTNLQSQPTNNRGANPANPNNYGGNNQNQQITQVLQTIQTSLQNNSSDNLSKAMNALTTALQNATGKKSEFKFDGKVNIQGLDKAGRDQAIGQVVVSVLQAFYKELDKSDPAESQLAEKLQNAIKTIVKEK